ncbi:hypothetical protein BFJ68_g7194 [Fusarium oxysporum]|uniref:Uncharacterized protein n=11 Tax=Fusarium oxysporum TaxID=5507 RepID=A0A420R947_FUSOX|nr:hypothetical protein FOXYS1_10344 [Fusarium oxysporum]KAJ4284200.1 hypothetical protein NW764_001755 [Fusarium oxysporum]RKK60809.1 hypothetical protein BFJ67_g1985 [Fusarium oxysporum f. sp. cepae]RKL13532.1 hypothetical protein BFJ68_g7194 [Fusarium oxysporum]
MDALVRTVSCYLKKEMLWIALVTAHTDAPPADGRHPIALRSIVVAVVDEVWLAWLVVETSPKPEGQDMLRSGFGTAQGQSSPLSRYEAIPDHITFMSGNDLTEPRGRAGMFKQYYEERSSYKIISERCSMYYFNVPGAFDHWTDELSLDRLPTASTDLATGSVMACNPSASTALWTPR